MDGAGEGKPRFQRLTADPQTSMRHARAAPRGVPANPVVWCAPQPAGPTCQGTGSSVRLCPSRAGVTSALMCSRPSTAARGEAGPAKHPTPKHPKAAIRSIRSVSPAAGRYPTIARCAPALLPASSSSSRSARREAVAPWWLARSTRYPFAAWGDQVLRRLRIARALITATAVDQRADRCPAAEDSNTSLPGHLWPTFVTRIAGGWDHARFDLHRHPSATTITGRPGAAVTERSRCLPP